MGLFRSLGLQIPHLRRLVEGRDALLREVIARRAVLQENQAFLAQFERERASENSAVAREHAIEVAQLTALLTKRSQPLAAGLFGGEEASLRLVERVRQAFVVAEYPLPPPAALQRRVVGDHVPGFVESGFSTINDFNAVLASNLGRTIRDFGHVFDFGVGCGRVLRRMAEAYPNLRLTGGDIDDEAITWLQQNYAPYGEFVTLPHRPPSSIADASFDLVYGISVFTHLPEDMQFEWLQELQRVTMPGAILLLTVHGDNYLTLFPAAAQEKAREAGGFFYNDDAGLTGGLPEFYKNTYHTQEYIVTRWGAYFDILQYAPLGLEGHQDIVVCRRRA